MKKEVIWYLLFIVSAIIMGIGIVICNSYDGFWGIMDGAMFGLGSVGTIIFAIIFMVQSAENDFNDKE